MIFFQMRIYKSIAKYRCIKEEISQNIAMKNVLLSLFLLLLVGCSGEHTSLINDTNIEKEDTPKRLVIWALSDIQPEELEERVLFENAISDMNSVGGIDIALLVGDLLKSRSEDEEFAWFFEARSKSHVSHWFEIAGNHDARSQPLFSKYFTNPPYYGVSVGNILILMLSDISVSSKTNISKDGFLWWKEMVQTNQDKIIITVTHAQLRKSGLLGSFVKSRVIEESADFEKVLEKEKVALWFSGHSHLPHGLPGTVSFERNLNNTCFINVSSIDEAPFLDSESRLFEFTEGSSIAKMRSRNHTEKRFSNSLNIDLDLGKPFIWDGSEPVLILPEEKI